MFTLKLKLPDQCRCLTRNYNHKRYHSHWSILVKTCQSLHKSGMVYVVDWKLYLNPREGSEPHVYILAEREDRL